MKVSVIIPTFNRRPIIERTLPTVLGQSFPADEYEVVVVVDGSTDGTAGALKAVGSPVRLCVVEQENAGQAAARNTGLLHARGELVLFLDDDLYCDKGLVAAHAAAHDGLDGPGAVVFGRILVAGDSKDTLATKWLIKAVDEYDSRVMRQGVSWPADACVGANASVKKKTLDAAGGYDERFFRAREDWDLGQRLWDNGVRFMFCPEAVAHQLYEKTPGVVVLKDGPLYGASEALFCLKHPGFRRASTFANFQEGPPLKRKARELCVRMPFPLGPSLRLAEGVARINPGLGVRMFDALWKVSIYRSLVKVAGGWEAFRRGFLKTLPVLMYHRVGPRMPGTYPDLTVRPESFRRQIAWLKRRGYSTVRASDWHDYCLGGKPLPEKPVLITFDDAYSELVEYAFPVLREYGFTATVFVVTGEVGGSNSWDQGEGFLPIGCMSAREIREWSDKGFEFGAHSRTHPDLTSLSAEALDGEVSGSRRDLMEMLGQMPVSFAYPGGSYNDAVLHAVEGGFNLAFTCEEGLNFLATKPHLMRRAMVRPRDSMLVFGLCVRLGYNPMERLRALFKVRTRLKAALGIARGL